MAKVKQKTNRAAAKRFKITGTGKVVYQSAGKRHLNTGGSRTQLRRLKGTKVGSKSDMVNVLRCLPNGSTM